MMVRKGETTDGEADITSRKRIENGRERAHFSARDRIQNA